MVSDQHAPFLPADKARAAELYALVKGTDREQTYRDISACHPNKEANCATYLAFLCEIEAMFVDALPVPTAVSAFLPNVLNQPDVVLDAADGEADASDVDEQVEGTDEPPEEETEPGALEVEADTAGPDTGAPLEMAGDAQQAILPVAGSGLISGLAGMLADGGQLSFTMMRVGDEVTLSVSPKPYGTESVVPLLVTATPASLDEHLVTAMQPYSQARRNLYTQCLAAAMATAASQRKASEKPGSVKSGSTYQLTLDGMPDTTFTATNGGKPVDVAAGTQAVKPGTLSITARHAQYGEHTKTLMMTANRTHDFRDQQGATLTLDVTPGSAAITAIQGEQRVALHGEAFLAPGKWLIEAEADGHTQQSKSITVVAGKAQTLTLTLPEQHTQSLF